METLKKKAYTVSAVESKERFGKIINFLESLDSNNFNYGKVAKSVDSGHCGSSGCVLGWFPHIFEGEFMLETINEIKGMYYPVHTGDRSIAPDKFLGISYEEYEMLFEPGQLAGYIDSEGMFMEYEEWDHLDADSPLSDVICLFKEFYKNEYSHLN